MADRRMFSKEIIDSDAFLSMPSSAQSLYFHFGMRADDDGFVNNSKAIMRMVSGSEDDYKLLFAKKFIIPFDRGVCVIKHWRIHNYIQKDRYKETKYKKEKAMLELDENKAYTLTEGNTEQVQECTSCIQDVSIVDTQVRLGKVSIDKNILSAFFERIWCAYPSKKGKGRISETQIRKLYDIGEEEVVRAIARYKDDLKTETWRKPQNGSTFFNTGLVDYLDKNYTPSENERRDQDAAEDSGLIGQAIAAGITKDFEGF